MNIYIYQYISSYLMPVEGLPVCAWSREHSIKTSSPCGNDVIAVSKY